ncbi:MAG: hypothetical protein KC621_35345, partial [Myxococcales bacterium]|nr:hypothetical protein [Myxococcales bacterium]
VAVAQHYGFTGIEAVDVASEIGDIVAEKYADVEVNPYTHGDTERVLLDGRAAILHSDHDYDVIQMVHANLHSSAGQVSNAWSPALLETEEAFELYLSKLTPDGTLSFGRGPKTKYLVHACVAAMEALGIEHPEGKIVWVQGPASVFLAKTRDWTPEEVARIAELIKARKGQYIYYDPTKPDHGKWKGALKTALLTDDRPYLESGHDAWISLGEALAHFVGLGAEEVQAATIVYHALVLQALYTVVIGGICVIVPMFLRGRELAGIRGVAPGLLYVACLGYGYLAVETVLLHQLVLFVGHPTYAITVVILAMLLFSGIGSMLVERIPEASHARALTLALIAVVVLGAIQGFVVPPILSATALGLPIAVRAGIVVLVLAPLGLVMGLPFPLAMRLLRPEAAGLVPWAWAVNGWLSVTASMGTVILSRIAGYHVAFVVALLAYVAAALLAPSIPRIGRTTAES